MKRITAWPLTTVLALALALLLALSLNGCGTTQPAKFYMLNASAPVEQSGPPQLNIGLGPIRFPAYLDRNKIMVRTGSNSFKAAEYHRWAEPLEDNFSQVLALDLGNALPGAVVTPYPWRNNSEVQLQVLLEVLSFDSDDHNRSQLQVRWELLDSDKKTVVAPQLHHYTKTAESSGYEARVAAMSECVMELGQALAQEISRISQK